MDKDDLFLLNIDRLLNENIQLLKLFKQMQKDYIMNKQVIYDNTLEDMIDYQQIITDQNKRRIRGI